MQDGMSHIVMTNCPKPGTTFYLEKNTPIIAHSLASLMKESENICHTS